MKTLAFATLLLTTACTVPQVTRDLAATPTPVASHQSDDDAPQVAAAPAPKKVLSLPIGRPDKITNGVTHWDNGDGTHGATACCMPAR